MRGKVKQGFQNKNIGGITPAYAGKRPLHFHRIPPGKDHPRVCGEKRPELFKLPLRLGSPPRMRGKVPAYQVPNPNARITPAYAGKSALSCSSCPCGWDHPRVCGEKCLPIRCLTPTPGSPPRVRGKGVWNLTVVLFTGITPACAGKRPCWCSTLCCWWDHPRVCGEKKAGPTGQVDHQGSPPRVRGKVPFPVFGRFRTGITPACAGKSTAHVRISAMNGDHPRVCGEK